MRIIRFVVAIIILSWLFLLSSFVFAQENNFVPGQIIVKYKQNQSPDDLIQAVKLRSDRAENIFGVIQNTAENINFNLTGNQTPEAKLKKLQQMDQQINLKTREQLKTKSPDLSLNNIYLLKTENQDVTQLINAYKSLSNVDKVEPNVILKISLIPNDTYYPDQWHYPKISLPQAWDISTGTNNIVAIIDSGIDYNHPDLPASRIIKGHDYTNNDEDPLDDNGHGTFVAGTIGAITNNNLGVAGINWNVRMLVYKIMDSKGEGNTYALIQALVSAADYGAKVANLSLGGDSPCAELTTLQDTIDYAYNKGTTVVVAAGNENADASGYSPASCNNVISVGATSSTDTRAAYSNYGTVVDIAAPGGNGANDSDWIVSTYFNNEITEMIGTSMAAPHVAGVISLMLSKNPALTPSNIETILKNSADSITTDLPIGKRLNAYHALLLTTGQPIPTPSTSPIPSPTPSYTIDDLKQLLKNYLSNQDTLYKPVDNKVNILDSGWVIKWLYLLK